MLLFLFGVLYLALPTSISLLEQNTGLLNLSWDSIIWEVFLFTLTCVVMLIPGLGCVAVFLCFLHPLVPLSPVSFTSHNHAYAGCHMKLKSWTAEYLNLKILVLHICSESWFISTTCSLLTLFFYVVLTLSNTLKLQYLFILPTFFIRWQNMLQNYYVQVTIPNVSLSLSYT